MTNSDKPGARRRKSPFVEKWDDFRIAVKFHARQWYHRKTLAATAAIFAEAPLPEILAHGDHLAHKAIRPYLLRGLKAPGRVSALRTHYQWLKARIRPDILVQSHIDRVPVLSQSLDIGTLTVTLGRPQILYREAEWRVAINLNGVDLTEIGFTLVPGAQVGQPDKAVVALIGIIKASQVGNESLDPLRDLTKSLEGLRPKSLLLLAVQAIASALGVDGIVAVSNEGRMYAGYRGLKDRTKADYDAFWVESGATAVSPYLYDMPLEKPQRDPLSYKANKRAQIRRRQQLEDSLTAEIVAQVTSWRLV